MSERERWIVYPLLFLALGASLRDKLADRTTSKSIECEKLVIVDEDHPNEWAVQIGLTQPTSPGQTPVGLIAVKGQMVVEGEVLANSVASTTVAADNYLYRRVPFVPALQTMLPGLPPDVLHALQKAWQSSKSPNGSQPDKDPVATSPPSEPTQPSNAEPQQAQPPNSNE